MLPSPVVMINDGERIFAGRLRLSSGGLKPGVRLAGPLAEGTRRHAGDYRGLTGGVEVAGRGSDCSPSAHPLREANSEPGPRGGGEEGGGWLEMLRGGGEDTGRVLPESNFEPGQGKLKAAPQQGTAAHNESLIPSQK